MFERFKLKSASVMYQYAFPLYRWMYFNFKNKKDKHHLSLIRKLIRPGDTVLDVGANIGFYSAFFSQCVGGDGHVYCFEPDKTNFSHLQKEMEGSGNATLLQKAVAAETGTLTLYVSPLLNVDHRTFEPEEYSSTYEVQKISLDDFVAEKFNVSFIKMDIQGFEMEALKGMRQILQSNKNILLFTELWPFGLQRAGSSSIEVFNFLSANGFMIYKVGQGQLTRMTAQDVASIKVEFLSDVNILASKNELIN